MDIRKVTSGAGRFYEVNRKRYPSITTVLAAEESPFLIAWRKKVGEEEARRITKESSLIGTAMHLCFERHLKGEPLPESTTKEEQKGREMFNAGKLMISNFVGEIIAQEQIVWSDVLRVAGQFDLLCKNKKGEVVLVDFKSTKKRKTESQANNYRLQTAFYRHCIKETLGVDIHHSALFFVTRDCEPYWMRFENDATSLKELIEARMKFVELKGW